MINVYIADDHSIVREGIRSLVSSANDMTVVGEAPDGDLALLEVPTLVPTVFLMDMSMPGCSGLQLIEKLRRKVPETKILVLSMHQEALYASRSIRSGAHGFITKTQPPDELLEALRLVSTGELYITKELAQKLARESLTGQVIESAHSRLTKRENEVFSALIKGTTVSEIATQLHLSSKTVSTHKARLMEKLGVRSLSELVRYAITHDLL